MSFERFTNSPTTRTTQSIDAVTDPVTFTVTSAANFPPTGDFRVIIDSEIMKVTSVSGNSFTASRGGEGTTMASHLSGATCSAILTAGLITGLFNSTSPRVVYANQYGLCSGVSLTDPTVGVDTSAALQALIDSMSGVYWKLVVDGPIKCHDVKLRSGMTLSGLGGAYNGSGSAPIAGIMQGPSGTCAVRNYNWRSPWNGSSGVPDYSRVLDYDITISDLFINGNRGSGNTYNAAAYSGDSRANASGQWMSPVQVFGCRNFQMQNVCIYDPPTFGIHAGYIDGGVFRDNQIWDPIAINNAGNGSDPYSANTRNTDGLHVNGPARKILIDGLSGATADDFLALNAEDGHVSSGVSPTANGFGAWSNLYIGDITDVTARGLRITNTTSVFRALSCSKAIDRTTVSDVRGTISYSLMNIGVFSTIPGNGNIGTLTLEDWTIDAVSNNGVLIGGGGFMAGINGNADVINLRNFTFHNVNNGGNAINYFDHYGGTINYIECRGHTIMEKTTDGAAYWVQSGGIVGNIRFIDCYRSRSDTNGLFYVITAGTCFYAGFHSVELSGSNSICEWAAGTMSSVSLVGCTCTSIAGAAVILAGHTLPRLRASGSNLATLVSGTVTSKKTDSTEDA